MQVIIKCGDITKTFDNQETITIGSSDFCDFKVPEMEDSHVLKMCYAEKYNSFVLMNVSKTRDLLCEEKNFSKLLVKSHFNVSYKGKKLLDVNIMSVERDNSSTSMEKKDMQNNKFGKEDVFNNDVEKGRIAIIKEIGFRILELKNNIKSANITNFVLNATMVILSVVSSFAITNFLLGFKISNTSSVLNLTTNFGFLICVTAIVMAICLILKQGVYNLLDIHQNKRLGVSDMAPKFIIGIASFFMFIVYVINLFYYKAIPGFMVAALFVSMLFVGALTVVTVGSGYFKFQIKNYKQLLQACEYREDFENIMKSYRRMISLYVNKLSSNKINSIKNNLVNNQMKVVLETFIGMLTAPFLAYGVSNTLASCFPEAANWVRISGLRFSPIFLILAIFLIIFAFFSFVRAFTIGKQIKASEIIKFDGFHDYTSHGVTVLGLDSMRSLEKEKKVVMIIACTIIFIEFTMNVSYFITEIGGDIQGMFLSMITAIVPTALLIAETHLLSDTMFKINNYNEVLEALD